MPSRERGPPGSPRLDWSVRGMAGQECAPRDHRWAGASDGSGARNIATTNCVRCGTGHEIGFLPLAPGTVQVSLRIFPARGATDISRDLILWALTSWGQTCGEIAGDGYTVVHGSPRCHPGGNPGPARLRLTGLSRGNEPPRRPEEGSS